MPQTLLALLALALGALLVLQQGEQTSRTEHSQEASEVARHAADVALSRLAYYETLAFDQATVSGPAAAPGALALIGAVAQGSAGATASGAPPDDLGDVHGTAVTLRRPVGLDSVDFVARTQVAYVSEADGETASSTPTRFKKVSVSVVPRGIAGADTVRIAELFMCGSACDF